MSADLSKLNEQAWLAPADGASVSKMSEQAWLAPPEGASVSQMSEQAWLSPPEGVSVSKSNIHVWFRAPNVAELLAGKTSGLLISGNATDAWIYDFCTSDQDEAPATGYDPTVTSSLYLGCIMKYITKTGTSAFGTEPTPTDIINAVPKLVTNGAPARTNLLVEFPELTTLPFVYTGGGLGNLPGISGLHLASDPSKPSGPAVNYQSNGWAWYNNSSATPAQDMWWGYGGTYSDYQTYDPILNDAEAYFVAKGGPYVETRTYWDAANTILKTVTGKGVIVDYHDNNGVNPDVAAYTTDHFLPIYGRGNYSMWSFDFVKYFMPTRPA